MSTSPRWSEHSIRRRVQFHETDAAGIVHFSSFFLYMEEAEHALWRQAGLSIARGADGLVFPRVSAAFEFHRPLRFEDEFDISIRIEAIRDKTIRYACQITQGVERIAAGTLTVICVRCEPGGEMKATAIPPEIAGRFEAADGTAS